MRTRLPPLILGLLWMRGLRAPQPPHSGLSCCRRTEEHCHWRATRRTNCRRRRSWMLRRTRGPDLGLLWPNLLADLALIASLEPGSCYRFRNPALVTGLEPGSYYRFRNLALIASLGLGSCYRFRMVHLARRESMLRRLFLPNLVHLARRESKLRRLFLPNLGERHRVG